MKKNTKTIVIFGGDGFCGWPTALYLSKAGYKIIIVDNLSRRKIDIELECDSLTPIKPIHQRIKTWGKITGQKIEFFNFDISKEYYLIKELFEKYKPMTVIHFAEQRSAPFSMKSSYHKQYTVKNNVNATHNMACAIAETEQDIHLIHLGTTGVYGYGTPGIDIPEGYLDVEINTDKGKKKMEIMYPANPGSIYHLTKTQDALTFFYYNKNDGLRVTDLHQGIVWGTNTEETLLDEDLINRFDYDGDYGTVLNRFLMQAAIDHPLTIYGTGGQTRAFINIQDTVKCLKIAVENPPEKKSRVQIFNQTTECHNILTLAKKIKKITNAKIRFYKNPRIETGKNNLNFSNKNFLKLGLNPITLDDGLMSEIYNIAKKYKHRCDMSKIICTSVWKKNMDVDFDGTK